MKGMKKVIIAVSAAVIVAAAVVIGVIAGGKKEISVNFNTGGGVEISAVDLKEGAEYELPTPTKEGYSFEGWYTSADFSGEPVTKIVASKNVTYYAKWEKLYAITLDAAGGTLSQTGKLYLKAGANVYEMIQAYTPTKENCQFGKWLIGEDTLSKNTKMPAADITLTAVYKVSYTVQIWEQKITQDGYEVRTLTEYAYAGESITSEQTVTGFVEVIKDSETEKTVSELTISETVANNVFVHYFDRETYTVTFYPNYPNGMEGASVSESGLFGKEIEIPSDYTFEGHCLVGWSTSATGEVVYKANYIQNALYGAEDSAPATFQPERNTALYAVWEKGYRDMFGNGDYIYLFEEEVADENGETKTEYSIYLYRSGVLFKGIYEELDGSFRFTNVSNRTTVKGRLNDNGTFIYSDTSKAEYATTLFVSGKGLQNTKIYFDEYDGITYSETRVEMIGEEEKEISYESTGTYYVDEYGYYVATFTDGELAGQTLTMITGYVPNAQTGEYIRAFQVRNEEEYNMGELVRFDVYDNTLVYWKVYQIILDGFGSAKMIMDEQGQYQSMRYLYDSETKLLTLLDNYGEPAGAAFIIEQELAGGTVKGYALYNEELDNVYPFDNGKLILDGMYNATFEKKDGTKAKGYYTLASSAFGGVLVNFKGDDGVDYKFMITRQENEITNGDQTITTISYIVEQKNTEYAEYYYKDEEAIWYGPILTIDSLDGEEGTASLYAFTPARTYELISIGTVKIDEATGLYTYTAEEYFTPETEVNTSPIDLSTVKTMVCALDTEASQYAIHYWYSYTTEAGKVEGGAIEYTSAKQDDNSSLVLIAGVAILRKDGAIITAQYATDEKTGITQIQTATGASLYVKLDEENKTFVELDYAPYKSYLLGADGDSIISTTYGRTEMLSFDGFGGVTYSVKETEKGEVDGKTEAVVKFEETYVGTYEKLEEETTLHGVYVYLFKGVETTSNKSIEFKYIEIPYSRNYSLFAKFNETYNGVYQSPEFGKLELDGYGYWATYTDIEGNSYESKYFVRNENEITFVHEEVERYFDLKESRTFTLRGIEYGTYVHANNQYLNNLYFEMDGYGKLTVYTMVKNAEDKYERQDVDTDGTYERNGYDFTFRFTQDDVEKTLYGALGIYGDYPVFIEKMSGVAGTYVNGDDLSVLILDELGNAVKHTQKGAKEYGYYTLITDEILYYMNASASDACIYHYNVDEEGNRTAVISKFEPRGYYTADLESLIFTEYGFAIFGGQTRYYYDIDEDFNVTIFREAEEGEAHNGYGFVSEEFGAYDTEVTYGGKKYFATDGLAITFKRDAATKEEYPITNIKGELLGPISQLSFAPTGDGEFTVKGKVYIDAKDYNCYVTRKVDEDGNVELYVTIDSYRFDISVEYKGDNADGTSGNTYKVTRMRNMVTTHSYTYGYMYYLYYSFMGQEAAASYENTFGEIAFVCEYDKEGKKQGTTYAQTKFGKDSKLYDTKGELFSSGEYTIYDEEGNAVELEEIKLSTSSKTFVYVLYMESEGYQYKFYFAVGNSMVDGMLAYQTVAFVREETLKTTDGYTINMQTVIASDMGYKAGEFFDLEVIKGEGDDAVTIEGEAWFDKDGATYYIVREFDEDGKITKTTYYKLSFVKDIEDSMGGGMEGEGDGDEGEGETDGEGTDSTDKKEEVKIVPLYKSVAVTVEEGKTIYAENGEDYVDINVATGKVMVLAMDDRAWIVMSSEYDAETQTYTVNLSATKAFSVKVVEGEDGEQYITIEEIVEEEEETV